MVQFTFVLRAQRDVGEKRDVLFGLTLRIDDRANGQLLGILCPVFVAVSEFTIPMAFLEERTPHRREKRSVVSA